MGASATELDLEIGEVESAALALPAEARARLAARLIESLEVDARREELWAAEIRERVRAFDAGEMEDFSEEESDAILHELLR